MKLYAIWFLCFCFYGARAQNTQVWGDYVIDVPFATQYLFEVETSYQTLIADSNKWNGVSLSPMLEYSFTRLDVNLTIPLSYTHQSQGYNTFETRITAGATFHITENKRVNTRFTFKADKRYLYNIEEKDWESSSRMRLKGEATISINGPNLFKDKLWYAIVDYEEYFVTDQQLDERYANRRRGRIGIGYRLNYMHRFEMIYTVQSARNEIEESFLSTDNIIQLRYKMFLNPAKPVTTGSEN